MAVNWARAWVQLMVVVFMGGACTLQPKEKLPASEEAAAAKEPAKRAWFCFDRKDGSSSSCANTVEDCNKFLDTDERNGNDSTECSHFPVVHCFATRLLDGRIGDRCYASGKGCRAYRRWLIDNPHAAPEGSTHDQCVEVAGITPPR